MLVIPQIIEYHGITAEIISQQTPDYLLTPSENAESFLKEGVVYLHITNAVHLQEEENQI